MTSGARGKGIFFFLPVEEGHYVMSFHQDKHPNFYAEFNLSWKQSLQYIPWLQQYDNIFVEFSFSYTYF